MQSGMPTPRNPAAEMNKPGWPASRASMRCITSAWPTSCCGLDRFHRYTRVSVGSPRMPRIFVRSPSAAFDQLGIGLRQHVGIACAAEKGAQQRLSFGRALRPLRRDPGAGRDADAFGARHDEAGAVADRAGRRRAGTRTRPSRWRDNESSAHAAARYPCRSAGAARPQQTPGRRG